MLISIGLTLRHVVLLNVLSAVPVLLGGIVGVAVGTEWKASPWVFAITAGFFVYIALVNMV